jgi:hypothetical protein
MQGEGVEGWEEVSPREDRDRRDSVVFEGKETKRFKGKSLWLLSCEQRRQRSKYKNLDCSRSF